MKYVCPHGCETEVGMSEVHRRAGECCEAHGERFVYEKQLKRSAPLRPVSEKREGEVRRRGSTLKQGRGMAASPAQQKKVRDLPCVVCGQDRHEATIHPAHVWPRTYTPCECADGVVPLCAEHHAQYDAPDHPLDLLSYLVRGYRVEFCHAFVAHDIPISELLRRVTGTPWRPLAKPDLEAVSVGG